MRHSLIPAPHGNFTARIIPSMLLAALVLSTLQACVAVPARENDRMDALLAEAGLSHGKRPRMPSPGDIHHLTAEQQRDFLEYFHSEGLAAYPPHRRLFYYLQDRESGFEYRSDTLKASDALELNSGNCLTLAIKTTALARLAGLEVGWQLMNDGPVYDVSGPFVEKGVHVRTAVYGAGRTADQDDQMLGSSPVGSTIDYLRTGRPRFVMNLSYEEYVAMYYRNLAVESLRDGDDDLAHWYSVESLRYTADHPDALNTLAVINRQAGRHGLAERIYLYAIERADNKLTLLKNYRTLLASQGRDREARRVEQRLRAMPDGSPFRWYRVAQSAFDDGDFRRAIDYYRRALALAPYLHEAHMGIASASYQLGRPGEAREALRNALELTSRRSSRKVYEAKMAAYYTDN